MSETARFYLDVPLEQIDRLEEILDREGIEFCPVGNMLHLPRENLLDGVFTGADAEYGLRKLNEFLQEHGLDPVGGEFGGWPHEKRRDMLELLTMHADWTSEHEPELLDISREKVREFALRHGGEPEHD